MLVAKPCDATSAACFSIENQTVPAFQTDTFQGDGAREILNEDRRPENRSRRIQFENALLFFQGHPQQKRDRGGGDFRESLNLIQRAGVAHLGDRPDQRPVGLPFEGFRILKPMSP